jgi:hypothetical protein
MSLIKSLEAQNYLRFIFRNIFSKINLIQLNAFINEKEAITKIMGGGGTGMPDGHASARDSGASYASHSRQSSAHNLNESSRISTASNVYREEEKKGDADARLSAKSKGTEKKEKEKGGFLGLFGFGKKDKEKEKEKEAREKYEKSKQ